MVDNLRRSDLYRSPPGWYWVVAAALTLWGAAGCAAFYRHATLGVGSIAGADGYDQALYAAMPDWYHWAYGAAVIGTLAGGLALLARRRLAQTLFFAALVAVAIQYGWLWFATDYVAAKGIGTVGPMMGAIVVIALFATWFSGWAATRGWLR